MSVWKCSLDGAVSSGKLSGEVAKIVAEWRNAEYLVEWAQKSIDHLLQKELWKEIADRFFCTSTFGTAGIRGRVIATQPTPQEMGPHSTPTHAAIGSTCINDIIIARATIALYRHCENWILCHSDLFDIPKLVIAYDNRHFSRHFAEITAGIWEVLGGNALLFDAPRSTPQLSFFVRHLRTTAGVMITASHNPKHDNGFKAYFSDGAQVVDPHASAIATNYNALSIDDVCKFLSQLRGNPGGYKILPAGLDEIYCHRLEENIIDRSSFSRESIAVAYSPLHGTGWAIMDPLMRSSGIICHAVEAQCALDPNFSTVASPNPENREAFSAVIELANERMVDLAIITDPDGDRMAVATRNRRGGMEILNGNQMAILLAAYRLEAMERMGWLRGNNGKNAALIASYVTSPLLDALAKEHGVKIIRTPIGFKWIGEKLYDYERKMVDAIFSETGLAVDYDMLSSEAKRKFLLAHSTFFILGAEESCGYMGIDMTRDKDSHGAAIMVCEMFAWLRQRRMTIMEYLHSIYGRHGYHEERLQNIHCTGVDGMEAMGRCLKSLENNPIVELAGRNVVAHMDFGKEEIRDEDTKVISKQAFWILDFDDGFRIAIRASGTEPKMKCYLFYRDYHRPIDESKERAEKTCGEFMDAIRVEINGRMGN